MWASRRAGSARCATTPSSSFVTYVYGDGLKHDNGRVWPLDVGLDMAADRPGSWCYVVEVCTECHWNHLHEAFVAPRRLIASSRKTPRERHDVSAGHVRGKFELVTRLDDELAIKTAPARAPRGRRHAPTKKRKGFKAWLRRWWWVFVVVPLVAAIGLLLTLFYIYSQLELPKTPPPLQTTYIYDREGHQIATLHSAVDRTIIPLSDMPPQLRHAVIAVEDTGFYDHPGIDVGGIFRAAWTDLVSGEVVQGGSTLTQQLVKNVYAGQYDEGSRDRCGDLRGPAADARAEGAREPARDQGRARVHQGPDPGQVPEYRLLRPRRVRRPGRGADVLPQGRVRALGARIRAARRHDPEPLVLRPDRAGGGGARAAELRPRADGLRGLPHPERAAQLEARDVKVDPIEVGLNFPGKLGYFLDYTRRSLLDEYDEGLVFGGGLQVTTTLDSQMQLYAEEEGHHLDTPAIPRRPSSRSTPRNGAVRAMYGGRTSRCPR